MAMLDYQKAMEGKHWLKNQLLLSISEDLKWTRTKREDVILIEI